MLSNPPPFQSGLVHLAIIVPSLSSHAWWYPIHPTSIRSCASGHYSAFSVKSCLMISNPTPTSIRSCASGHYSAFFVNSCLMLSNPPPLQSGLVHLAITVSSLSSHAWWYPIHPTSIRSCASGHYSAFSVKLCLMLSNPPPLQSGLVRLAITAPSLSSHAWWCPIHPHINQVLCIWPLQCLLCQVMLDDVQSTPTSIRSCASGHYSAFSVKSCLMMSNPPPLQSGHVRLAKTVPSLSSHAWCCPIHPTSIRSCASGHYSAFSVTSCLMLSNPPPLQSGIVRLAITVPSLSSHAWCCPIHPHFNPVLCVWPL